MKPDKKAILAHLDFLFSNIPDQYKDGRIEIAYTGANVKSLNQANYFGINEINAAADFIVQKNSIEGINMYVGAALRKPDCPPFGRSSLDDYYAATALWVDIDDKDAAEAAKPIYDALPPAFIVVTGRSPHKRFQAWWRLDSPLANHAETKLALSGLQRALNGDPSVVDAARIMRVGGTVAWPKKEGRVTEATEVFTLNSNAVNISDIKAAYPPALALDTYSGETRHDDGKPRNALTGQLEVKKLLEATKQPGHWNENMLIAIGSMVGRGWSNEQIRLACSPYSYGADSDQDVIDIINRTRTKFNVSDPIEQTPPIEDEIPITAKDITSLDLDNIPPRSWLFGTLAARKYVSMIAASPGAGKSMFTMQAGVCASAGIPFGTHAPQEKEIKTWVYNNEEGDEELRRRLKGILIHNNIDAKSLSGKYFMNSGEDKSICIARRNLKDGGVIYTPDYEALKNEIMEKKIDLLIVDPFAETHDLAENSNDDIKHVAGMYRSISIKCNCAVILVHHTRKGGGNDSQSSEHNGNMDNARGGGAQLGVVRRVFTLAKMDDAAAKKFDISPSLKRWYVRLDDAKSNITAPAENAEWFKFKSLNIGNGSGLHPEGDSIGVLVHKTADEITEEEDDFSKQERQLLLERLARIMIRKNVYENSVKRCVDDLLADGYGKYKERKLHDFLKQCVSKASKTPAFACEGNSCRFSIIEKKSKNEADIINLHIEELSCF